MVKKGFTLVEVLIVIAIGLILIFSGVVWYLNYQKKLTVEGETHKIYQTLKEIQLEAKLKKEPICVDLTSGGKELSIDKNCDGGIDENIPLKVPFQFKNSSWKLKVNQFGIWIRYNSIYAQDWKIAHINCAKAHTIRVCEGSWNASANECECVF